MKNIRIFYLKIFIFLVFKFSVYLKRHVFVMHFGEKDTNLVETALSKLSALKGIYSNRKDARI